MLKIKIKSYSQHLWINYNKNERKENKLQMFSGNMEFFPFSLKANIVIKTFTQKENNDRSTKGC